MKRIVLVCVIFLSAQITSQAQIKFGAKAGLNYNSTGDLEQSFNNTVQDVKLGADGKAGFHLGVWAQAKLPIVGMFIQPELIYTNLNSEYEGVDFSMSKIDIPVLFGTKILKIAKIYAGPSFSYILDSDLDLDNLSEIDSDDFSIAAQIGVGVEFGNFGLDLRYEKGLNKTETSFIQNVASTSTNFTVDSRPNQLIFGATYKF